MIKNSPYWCNSQSKFVTNFSFYVLKVFKLILFVTFVRKLWFNWNLRLILCFNMQQTPFGHKKFKENISAHRFRTWKQAQKFQSNMFKEIQQQAYGSRVGETPLPFEEIMKSWRRMKNILVFSKFLFMSKTKWQFQVIRETRTKEWRGIKFGMKNEVHLPKLDDSRAQEQKELAGKKKKNNWTPLPQALFPCKKNEGIRLQKIFFLHKGQ